VIKQIPVLNSPFVEYVDRAGVLRSTPPPKVVWATRARNLTAGLYLLVFKPSPFRGRRSPAESGCPRNGGEGIMSV